MTKLFILEWANYLIRYFSVAGLTYLILWKLFFPRFKHRFLYKKFPANSELKREVFYSFVTIFIFMLPTLCYFIAVAFGYSFTFQNYNDYGVIEYVVSFTAVFFLHDMYFYWTHRLMHTKLLFPYFHRVHHLSLTPTPLAVLALHPLEAMVQVFFFLCLRLFTPIPIEVIISFIIFSLFMNVYGHLGFNILSLEKQKKFPFNLLSHPTNHGWHHQFQNGNYSFYLQFWDRMMKTWKGELQEIDSSTDLL